jgi:chemotaxis protein histidine kinase CheA
MSAPTFNGTAEQQRLAAEVFRLMTAQGAMFAADAPIKQTLTNLADFLASRQQRDSAKVAQEIDAALQENAQIFARQEDDGEISYVTSRQGMYQERREDRSHSFRERLYEPEEPLPVDDISVVVSTSRPALTTVEPVFISDYWQQQAGLLPMPPSEEGGEEAEPGFAPTGWPPAEPTPSVFVEEVEEEPAIPEQPATPAPGVPEPVEAEVAPAEPATMPMEAATVEPTFTEIEAEAEAQAATAEAAETEEVVPAAAAMEATPEVAEPVFAEPTPPEVTEAAAEEAEAAAPVEPAEVIGEAEEVAAAEAEEEPAAAVAAEPAEAVSEAEEVAAAEEVELPAAMITLDDTDINLGQPVSRLMAEHGKELAAALVNSIDKDPLQQIARFGRDFFTTSDLVNLGKNDLRRIREYIVEVGEPVLDTAIIADLYYNSPRQSSFEGFRFSLNYRLSREKDFDFVGVDGAYLWSARGLPTIGSKRIKAGEMGQITSYLVEGYDGSIEQQSAEEIEETGVLHRELTFFEWEYGVLPLDASLATLLPKPLLDSQRSVVLRFESPQHYTTHPVEVRYPTGNRGGWLQGLEEFFHEHLVPGALVTLARTEEPNVFTITYEEVEETEDRILTLDEKKNKFAFANVTYTCEVDSDQFPSQQKFGKFKNLKSLPMSERRKADVVLQHVFAATGEQVGTRSDPLYWMSLDDLYVAFNVLRPAARPYLESLLESDDIFSPDDSIPGTYYYKPEPEPDNEEEEEEEEEDILMSGTYDDEDEY